MTEPREDHLLDELSVVGDEHADLAGRAYLRIKVLEAAAGVHLGDEGLLAALERAHDISEWIGTDIQAFGSSARAADRERWIDATVEACETIRAALATSAEPSDG